MNLLDTITNIVVATLVIPLVLFAWTYDRGAPLEKPRVDRIGRGIWRQSVEGRTIMQQKLSFILLVMLVIATRILGPFPGSDAIKLLVYVAVAVSLWKMYGTLLAAYDTSLTQSLKNLLKRPARRQREETKTLNKGEEDE